MNNICIDFGTCNSVISYHNEINEIKYVLNSINGDVLIPSTIFFIKNEITSDLNVDNFIYGKHYVIGTNANEIFLQTKEHDLYFYQFKRFLGITNKSNTEYIKNFNYKYELDDNIISFFISTNTETLIKINIIQMIKLYFIGLKILIKNTNLINNEDLNNIEIIATCPAYFYDLQRQQLISSIISSGFSIFKLCNEPTVASLYYFKQYNIKDHGIYIIFDLGGGTSDTTVIEYNPEIDLCEVIDIYGDNLLGGIDIDNIIIDNIYTKYNISKKSEKILFKIKNIAENIKIKLTYAQTFTTYLEEIPLNDKIATELKITYTQYEYNNLINKIVDKMIEPVIKMSKKYDTNNIIFIGGTTQIPLLQNKINSHLNINCSTITNNNNTLYKTIVSSGGSLLFNNIKNKSKMLLLDVLPMNIGICSNNDKMIVFVPKNSKFPFSTSYTFTTSHDGQRNIDINIYEGLSDLCCNNNFIGSYTIYGIPSLKKGMIIINITFQINANGLLNIFIDSIKNSFDENNVTFKYNNNIKLIPQFVAKQLF